MSDFQLDFFPATPPTGDCRPASPRAPVQQLDVAGLAEFLRGFNDFGTETRCESLQLPSGDAIPVFINEFWTAKQRAAHSLHEVSYRACFKPQLPRFFIERLTKPGEVVYDPFMGRGTTQLEAALLGRAVAGCDVNPLSRMLVLPRLHPPQYSEITQRLAGIDLSTGADVPPELLAFYHPETLRELAVLRSYFIDREKTGALDNVDAWIRMVSLNRLTGHSPGFFSVYTMPPNQAVSVKSQIKINERRQQVPEPRDIRAIIAKKSRQLLGDLEPAQHAILKGIAAQLLTGPCRDTPAFASNSVSLVVTSPPFLDIVDYATDNWLRCWFAGIDPSTVHLTVPKKLEVWAEEMTAVFRELHRVLKPGGFVAFEVGEVRKGKVRLEETVITCGGAAGLRPRLVLINAQEFTKTANCWGVDNNSKGTNTNRIVLFEKQPG